MAGLQPARDDVRAEGIVEWMERRLRQVAARGPEAELAGRAAWAAGGVAGELPYAPRPSDVVSLGARTGATRPWRGTRLPGRRRLDVQRRIRPNANELDICAGPGPTGSLIGSTSTARPMAPAAAAGPRPTQEDEMAKLRREQAAFKEVVREESRRNSWMAIPALAPMAVPLLAEGAALNSLADWPRLSSVGRRLIY